MYIPQNKKRSGTLSKSISNAFHKFTLKIEIKSSEKVQNFSELLGLSKFKIEIKSSEFFRTFRFFKFKIEIKSSEKVQNLSEHLGLFNLK